MPTAMSVAKSTSALICALCCCYGSDADPWQAPATPSWTGIFLQAIQGHDKLNLSVDAIAPPIAVDRVDGRLYLYGQIYSSLVLTSDDLGETYALPPQPLADDPKKRGWGREIYLAPLSLCPEGGGRLAVFSSGGGLTLDGGTTWTQFGEGPINGMDQGTVRWDDGAKTILVTEHNGVGKSDLMLSTDGGAVWKRLGKERASSTIGILPSGTIVSQRGEREGEKPGSPVFRSVDGGATWKESPAPTVDAIAPHAGVQFHFSVVNFQKKAYWLANSGVYTTDDDGATWVPVGRPFPAEFSTPADRLYPVYGPMFGRDGNHIVVMMNNQFIETMDAGAHWHALIPTPQPVLSTNGVAFAGYDPTRDILYFSVRRNQADKDWVYGHLYRAELKRRFPASKR